MNNVEAHEVMENELRCVQRAAANCCDRNCGQCPLLMDTGKIIGAYGYVIKMLEDIKNDNEKNIN